MNDCTVPAGFNAITITARGADGGNFPGGTGGRVTATFNVTPGDRIRMIIGQSGSNASASGRPGGGGGTGVINCGSDPTCVTGVVLVAAGGGGGGGAGGTTTAGTGNGGTMIAGFGGGGINSAGGTGGNGGGQASKTAVSPAGGRQGTASGHGGGGFGGGGGGRNVAGPIVGGGGGGGYSGGNGGSNGNGGGGGSNYVAPGAIGAVTNTPGDAGSSDNSPGSVTLSFSTVLPVELVSFTATADKDAVQLFWKTATEYQNNGFEIERSTNTQNWEPIVFVRGSGTTDQEQSYTWTDNQPLQGTSYYRLKQIDLDGASEYSKIVSIHLKGAGGGFSIYPNPATGSAVVNISGNDSGEALLTLYDQTGVVLQQTSLFLEKNSREIVLDLPDVLPGVYSLILETSSDRWQQRLILK